MSGCSYCGEKVGENALYCPKCLVPISRAARRRHPGTASLLVAVSLVFGGPCVWAISGQFRGELLKASISEATVHAATVPAARAADQAQALIRSCGAPDRDVSTANNDPRPPIPFRVLSYNGQHLQFAFVPGGGAQIGDPPPYRWALSGILDSTTNQRVSLQQATERMSCAAPLTALADVAPSSASAPDSTSANDLPPSAGPSMATVPRPAPQPNLDPQPNPGLQ
ncbi:MAG TPA: hypothetical protein VNJ52_04515 [Patescibacteria group bacterium]|nr:hypothetical protein [Patescibacteria group bacterium]